MSPAEFNSLREFLESKPNIKRMSRAKFQIDDRVVDFSSALELPEPPAGITKLQGAVIGWLGNQSLVLKMLRQIEEVSLKRIKKELKG
jgi:hypothetical protein